MSGGLPETSLKPTLKKIQVLTLRFGSHFWGDTMAYVVPRSRIDNAPVSFFT